MTIISIETVLIFFHAITSAAIGLTHELVKLKKLYLISFIQKVLTSTTLNKYTTNILKRGI